MTEESIGQNIFIETENSQKEYNGIQYTLDKSNRRVSWSKYFCQDRERQKEI